MEIKWKSEWTVPSVVGVVSFGIGIGVGYGIRSYLNSRLVRSFQDIIDEVEEEDQLRLNFNGHNPEIVEMVREEEEFDYITITEEEDHLDIVIDRSAHPSVAGLGMEPKTLFPEEDAGWDYEEQIAQRGPDQPYVIHVDEYNDNETNYSQSTLTYYKGDNVLCDELDMPIYNADKVASPLLFGFASHDPSIVYIRNERLEADYEVLLDHGYFQVEVLGEEIESSFESKKTPLHKFKEE
jgi:hypothetical protein